MARRLDYRFRIFQDNQELNINSNKITYVVEKATDDIGIITSFFKIPFGTAWTTYTRELRSDALFTYIKDLTNSTDDGVSVKLNSELTEYRLLPDLWTEKSLTAISAENDTAADRVILIVQAYPRAISFY